MEQISEPSTPSSPSLKQKLITSLCLPSPFRKHHHHRVTIASSDKPSLLRSSSTSSSSSSPYSPTAAWIRSRAHEIPEFKDKCVKFISRIGRHGGRGHYRRHSVSADFHYDASSYALNFDEGEDEGAVGEFPLRSFSSRLPPSPTRQIQCS